MLAKLSQYTKFQHVLFSHDTVQCSKTALSSACRIGLGTGEPFTGGILDCWCCAIHSLDPRTTMPEDSGVALSAIPVLEEDVLEPTPAPNV